jgi:nucleoid-associated protein YgaU
VTVTLEGGPDDGRTFPGVVAGNQVENPYLLEGIQPGEYRLRLEKNGYRTTIYPPANQPPLVVELNGSLDEDPVMVVVPDATFGRVVWDRNGSPSAVPGARVQIDGIASFNAGVTPTPVPGTWFTTTDGNGEFSFEGDEGPIFGDATVTVTFPDASSSFVANGVRTTRTGAGGVQHRPR